MGGRRGVSVSRREVRREMGGEREEGGGRGEGATDEER